MLRHCILLAFIFGAIASDTAAQVDTEFWFAPPEVTTGHGDRPLYLRISTLDQPAVINVTQPARGNVRLATANVAANTTFTITLSGQIANLETIYPARVMNTGIRITSTAPVTAYYEVGAPFNADIFALKGRNALGNHFVIPAQDVYDNSGSYNPTPSSSFDIVATQNNTVVRVRATKPIYGHQSESLITVKLNAGETYSFRKIGLLATDNPAGTVVESNKPIAITIKDDSVINGGCRDLLGDQLVPVEVAGTEYVVLKGFLATQEYIFVTATKDDTHVHISGSPSPVATLAAGEVYRHAVTRKSTYIRSDKTIYVFHVTGFGCEMGLAILPSINCKGSPQIGFSRTTNEFFGLNVLVRKEGIADFRLNGSSTLVPASVFSAVPGTNDEWYTAQLDFNTQQIPVGQASLISNARSSFQIGIINGNASSTCRYGYFSSFSTLFIGDDLTFCEGGSAVLDAGPGKESYSWSTGATTQKIPVDKPGEYWVRAEREACVLYDTIQVFVTKGSLDIGPDVEVCRGDTAEIDGKENFSWKWSDGSTQQFLRTTEAGKFWVSVSDYTGCAASDTIIISHKEPPPVNLGEDIVKCPKEEIILDAAFADATYRWNDGLTSASRKVVEEDIYAVTVTWNGCTATDSLYVENLPGPPQDSIYGTPSVCPFATGIDYHIEAVPQAAYEWFVEGGAIATTADEHVTIDWFDSNPSAEVKSLVTDESGCRGDTLYYPVRINVTLLPEVPDGPDTLCLNHANSVRYTTPETNGSVYTWRSNGGSITAGQGTDAVAIDWSVGLNSLWIEETSVTTDTVCAGVSSPLTVLVFEDTTALELLFVSVDTLSGREVMVRWTVEEPAGVKGDGVALERKAAGATEWMLIDTLPATAGHYADAPDLSAAMIYEYRLSLTNHCGEYLESAVHHNMFLSGTADFGDDVIRLGWNHYWGWHGGVDHYEVWRTTDHDNGYKFLANVSANENTFSRAMAADAFQHRYVIRAVAAGSPYESWSTPVSFVFEHPVNVPNVITPNGDGYNQYFHISKIELYHDSDLRIVDRWGKEVFHRRNYQNDWDGGGLASGIYYYILHLGRKGQTLKGTLTIR